MILRRRIWVGVTSTSSSSSMYSRAASSERTRGGLQQDVAVAAGGPHVGELLLLGRIDGHVAGAAVLADDHSFVDDVAGADEHLGPLLQPVEAEGHGLARGHRDQHAVGPAGDVAFDRAGSASKRWCMIAVPCVALSSRVRRPISPRAGIENTT